MRRTNHRRFLPEILSLFKRPTREKAEKQLEALIHAGKLARRHLSIEGQADSFYPCWTCWEMVKERDGKKPVTHVRLGRSRIPANQHPYVASGDSKSVPVE